MSCTNNIIDEDNINFDILVGPHESSSRIDRDSEFEVCAITFTCGITTPRIDGDIILGISTTLENLSVLENFCAPIGEPSICTTRPNDIFCENGGLASDTFSSQTDSEIGLDLAPDVYIADGFQLIDNWLKTYLMTQPPAFCFRNRISCEVIETASPDFFYVEWDLPPRRCLGIMDVQVPLINNVLIDFVESSKNPQLDFSHPDVLHITADPTTERFQAFTDQPSGIFSGMLGTTIWRQYTVEPGVEYDIRVYGKNYNCEHDFNYLIEQELCTLDIGIPTEPLNLTCGSPTIESINIQWEPPIDNNDLFPGDNDLPNLEEYQINYEAISSVRYGGVITHQNIIQTGNLNLTRTLSSLNPGTTYEFGVEAKNVINNTGGTNNDGFGPESNTVQCTTLLPNPPNELSSISLANTGTLTYSGGGRTLNGNTYYQYIYNYNELDPTNSNINRQIRTNQVSNIRNNFVEGTTATLTSTINAYSGLTPTYLTNIATTDLDGFSHSSQTGNEYFSNSNITSLVINADSDFYSSPTDYTGFWKDWNGWAVAYDLGVTSEDTSAIFYANFEREYKLLLEQVHNDDSPSHTNTPTELTFVIDDLNTNPEISNCGISELLGVTSTQIEYVTGIPTFTNDANFAYRFTITNIARKFLRPDLKHAQIELYLSDGTRVSNIETISQTDISDPNHLYWTPPDISYEIGTTKHNTTGEILLEDPGDIQFNDFEISFNSTLAQNVCDDDVTIRFTPYNLYGTGTTHICRFLDPDTGENKTLRIDTCSTVCLNTIDDSYGSRGQLVSSGTGQYPDLSNSGNQSVYAGINYDHSLNLVNDLPEQLALLKGLWQNPLTIDYNNFYFPNGTIIPDLSGISEDGAYRYVTFKYQRTPADFDISNPSNPDPAVTRDKLRLIINNPTGLTMDLSQFNSANHRLYLKIDGYGTSGLPTYSGDPNDGDPNNYDTYWLDCTNPIESVGIINGIQSQNTYAGNPNPPVPAGDGVACLNTGTSTVTRRDCYIPVVTNYTAIFYVRIGWPNNVDYNFACGISLEMIQGTFESNLP